MLLLFCLDSSLIVRVSAADGKEVEDKSSSSGDIDDGVIQSNPNYVGDKHSADSDGGPIGTVLHNSLIL